MADYNQFSGAGDLGRGIGELIGKPIKEKKEYESALAMARMMSQMAVKDGTVTQLNPDVKDKTMEPLFSQKAIEQITNNASMKRAEKIGQLKMLTGIGELMLRHKIGEEPKFETEVVPGEKLPLSASKKADVLMQQEANKSAPVGKQYWEGDDQAPAGYYTPRQIEDIRNRRVVQKSKSEFGQLRNDISVAKVKIDEKGKELNEFTKAYGFPAPLFDSKTKIYNEDSEVGGQKIPKGYYGFEAVNPKTGDTEVRHIGKEEFQRGKSVYEDIKKQRTQIGQLGASVQAKTAAAKAAMDWAEANPNDPRAAQAKLKAQADLSELGALVGGQPAPSPTPIREEDE